MRGEDSAAGVKVQGLPETPPHAWGRRHSYSVGRASGRNTPTCVGKTAYRTGARDVLRKHPHMRGEDKQPALTLVCCLETPPHAWGRLIRACAWPCIGGNTPTCVGKTMPFFKSGITFWKHPHMRGEDPNILL